MKNKLPTILLALSLTTLAGFDVGQEVELDSFLNARTHPNFLKYTKNIKTTLAKGTTGEVQEVKKFSSGNAGIKMKVTNGPKTGQSYWVYYNSKTPAIKLTDKKEKKEIPLAEVQLKDVKGPEIDLKMPEVKVQAVEGDVKAELLEPVTATRDASEHATEETVKESLNIKADVDSTLAAQDETDCATTTSEIKVRAVASVTDSEPFSLVVVESPLADSNEADYKLSDITAPFRARPVTVNEGTSSGASAPGAKESYDTLRNGRNGKVKGFSFTNKGPNSIVTDKDRYRLFEFKAEDLAKSDMKVELAEYDVTSTSKSVNTIMMFFPRTVLPAIKEVGNELHVTLPTKEVVKFNAQTKEIIGGVFSEEKMTATALKKPAHVKYNGSGVMIRADKAGDLAYGDIERNDGSTAPSVSIATVSKKGQKDCKIPSKDIWYNDKTVNDVLIKPELSTDEGLDNFIKKRCNFSLF